jgi:hypothetical protein
VATATVKTSVWDKEIEHGLARIQQIGTDKKISENPFNP